VLLARLYNYKNDYIFVADFLTESLSRTLKTNIVEL